MRKRNYIGLSVSICVCDILRGLISVDSVAYIIGGTRCATINDWDHVIRRYQVMYWTVDPQRAAEICRQLIAEGRIVQPRLLGLDAPNTSGGHWARAG